MLKNKKLKHKFLIKGYKVMAKRDLETVKDFEYVDKDTNEMFKE